MKMNIPDEARKALDVLRELPGCPLIAVYLYGSAVLGGLRDNSDVDIMAVVNQYLSEETRRNLRDKLMFISGKMGNQDHVRPLEVTVIHQSDVVPWQYPPRKLFMYGEWLRSGFEQGRIPESSYDPDLAILLSQIRYYSIPLLGPDAAEVLAPVPASDLRKAMKDNLPDLLSYLKGDERNVLLTLARMWATAVTGEFLPKDEAANWAGQRLPAEYAALLDLAGKAYRGEYADRWDNLGSKTAALAGHLKKEIESCLESE